VPLIIVIQAFFKGLTISMNAIAKITASLEFVPTLTLSLAKKVVRFTREKVLSLG
jgi:hypothetical protein